MPKLSRRFNSMALAFALIATQSLAANTSQNLQLHPSVVAAQALTEAEKFEEALAVLRPLILEDPQNADALCLAGYVSKHLGELAMAAIYYAQALESDPDHKGTLKHQGELYLALERPLKAEANLVRLGEICKKGCEEYVDLARAISAFEAQN